LCNVSDMARFKDFDAALASQEPIVVRITGRDWEFPSELPAGVVHALFRRGMGEDGEVSTTDAIDLWEHMIGQERLADLEAAGATWSQIEALSVYLMQEYGITDAGADSEVPESEDGDDRPPA